MKMNKMLVTLSLALPLATVTPAITGVTANAAQVSHKMAHHKESEKSFALDKVKDFKSAKTYKLKSKDVKAYKAMFMADQPVVSFSHGKTVKVHDKKVRVNKKITVKESKTKLEKLLKDKKEYKKAKNIEYLHAEKIGWIKATEVK
ncbi:hypothetical protein [Apilactobacillus timberlakei]|uniref:Surface layer protein A domain-containing protein n=1 Tax=Apilactobacillus timberlakei TaxID=2008380 RepID=A0ABY2YXX8_9LACO|nr:hypothetical protein [Apilactobacillus timberlakei]TPR13223.1 hypothetical protein DYZ97_04870 [Apilactobacillus timberlakei]TPR14261.1 hypothetical protein DY048_04760 [Apilactobacillus timberlakei]TPR16514.1 hypothetical protein DY052_02850 [Apilactobacillus timberlakei]TPR19571.1 hypothetical protein DY138_02700 [Apilactobacillus timberlakei]TPR20548.1 hypothetical protein DY061_04340 [Apilactobacillus timberlakei]